MRAKERAADWIWIIDHSIQLGAEKVLCVLGVRLSALESRSCHLTAQDVEPIAIIPVTKSTGEVVAQQLEAEIEKTGVPRLIVGDCGPDIKKGVSLLREKHPKISFIHDIKHKTALLLKKLLEGDPLWATFCQKAATSKLRLMQTALAFLAPCAQRAKCRYMNLEILLRWAAWALHFLDMHQEQGRADFNKNRLIQKLGWLHDFRKQLELWKEWLEIATTVEKEVKQNGYTQHTPAIIRDALTPIVKSKTGKKLSADLLDFVSLQSKQVRGEERLLGSSEIIESAFGKLKHLEKTQEQSGFTILLLALAALLGPTTENVIASALSTVPTKKVKEWKDQHLPVSLQAKRREAIFLLKKKLQNEQDQQISAEQIWDQLRQAA